MSDLDKIFVISLFLIVSGLLIGYVMGCKTPSIRP